MTQPFWWIPLASALVGGIVALAGVIISQRFQRSSQRAQAEWQQRIRVYGEFLTATDEVMGRIAARVLGAPVGDLAEAIAKFWSAQHQVILIGSPRLTEPARALGDLVRQAGLGSLDRTAPDHFMNLKVAFVECARSDLGSAPIKLLSKALPSPQR